MSAVFLQSELWSEIGRLAKRSKRRHIAVAYLGRGASKLIPLKKGDTLVVDMSKQAVKSGQTDPSEVERYLRAGAEVFSCSNLHAKVFVFDNVAIISSSNLSHHSQTGLVEAAVLAREPRVLQSARGFIRRLQVEPVTPKYLASCKRWYRRPKFGGGDGGPKRATRAVTPTYSRLWVSGIDDVDLSAEEEQISESEARRVHKKVRDKKRFEVSSLRWGGDSHFTRTAREGDLILQIYEGKVYPPYRIVGIGRKYKLVGMRTPRFFVYLEEEKEPRCIGWFAFKRSIANLRLGRLTPQSTREVKSPLTVHGLLGLWRS